MLTVNHASARANRGFSAVFKPGQLSLGVMLPIESYRGDSPTLDAHAQLAQRAEALGFATLGFRDVPLRDPTFGDVGQIFDPWVYMGYLAARTERVALLTTSIVLPLRHPIHTAKAAASLDQLTGGRLLLGVASGDRPVEFPAFAVEREARGRLLREQVALLRRYWGETFPSIASGYGVLNGADVIPKPWAASVPLLITGYSQSDLEWIAANADGWMTYPRDVLEQAAVVAQWRQAVSSAGGAKFKPFAQSYYVDLAEAPDLPPQPIHLGHRLGRRQLVARLAHLREVGVNHVVLNLKYGKRPAAEVLEEIGMFVTPQFRTDGS